MILDCVEQEVILASKGRRESLERMVPRVKMVLKEEMEQLGQQVILVKRVSLEKEPLHSFRTP